MNQRRRSPPPPAAAKGRAPARAQPAQGDMGLPGLTAIAAAARNGGGGKKTNAPPLPEWKSNFEHQGIPVPVSDPALAEAAQMYAALQGAIQHLKDYEAGKT